MPIVFCASFMPCERPMNPDDTICTFANTLLTMRGRAARPMRPPRLPRNDSSASRNPMTMKPMVNPAAGETIIGRITLLSRPLPSHQCPAGIDQMIECQFVAGRGERGAAESADQRVRRARWQAPPPGDQVPDRRAEQRADDEFGRDVDDAGIDQPRRNRLGDRRAPHRAEEVRARGEDDGLTGPQHFGGDDGRDRIRGVVETVDVLEHERDDEYRDDEAQTHGGLRSSSGRWRR